MERGGKNRAANRAAVAALCLAARLRGQGSRPRPQGTAAGAAKLPAALWARVQRGGTGEKKRGERGRRSRERKRREVRERV